MVVRHDRVSADSEWVGLIAYSEATRFTPEKYAQTVQWCKRNGKRVPQHTLYPRHRGFVATVQQLRQAPHVKAVYDITIAYAGLKDGKWVFMSAPSMWQSLSVPDLGKMYKFFVHAEQYPLNTLPEDDDGLKGWLEDRWLAKGERLEKLRLELEGGFWDGVALKEA